VSVEFAMLTYILLLGVAVLCLYRLVRFAVKKELDERERRDRK
jgi:hypothetical protein